MRESSVKEKLIDVAGRLFHKQGYNLTGINQVIEEADIARGSMYNHFQSKTDLLIAYLDQFQENWYRSLEEFLRPITDPKKRLLAIFDYRIRNQQRIEFCGCPFIKISAEIGAEEPEVLKRVQKNKDTLRSYLANMVAQVKHRNLLTNEALTEMMYLMMEGALVGAAIYKNADDLKRGKKIMEQLL
jgi:AcrR family transcriptional regulator